MAADRIRRVRELFIALREQQPARRREELIAACGDDEELRFEVESLLLEHDRFKDAGPSGASGMGAVGAALGDLEARAGESLGRYRILRLLGRGGMGAVYEAEDPELGRRVALKVLPAALAADPARLARFKREASSLPRPMTRGFPKLEYNLLVGAAEPLAWNLWASGTLGRRLVAYQGPLPSSQKQVLVRQL